MTLEGLRVALVQFDLFVLVYFVLLQVAYLTLCILSFVAIRRHLELAALVQPGQLFRSGLAPAVSVICPAYNEEATIVSNVQSLLALEYPLLEIVVVCDGCKDATLDNLRHDFQLRLFPRAPSGEIVTRPVRGIYRSTSRPNLVVVDKENGGKADAINAGINFTRNPYICTIDADSILEPDVLLKMIRPFLADPTTLATGGMVRIVNDSTVDQGRVTELRLPRSSLVRFQVVEYFRAFLFGRVGWASLNSLLIISGAFGMFLRRAVLEVGGFRPKAIGEDMELVVRLHRHFREKGARYRVSFLPEPVCWTEGPSRARILASQRNRWQRGLMETLWWHRTMLGNPRYGPVGMVAYPFFVLFELLGPLIELTGYFSFAVAWLLGAFDLRFALLFLGTATLLGVTLSLTALMFEGLTFRRYPKVSTAAVLIVYGVLENLGYRQLHAWWRLQGMWNRLTGVSHWGTMERRGFSKGPGPSPKPQSDRRAA